MLENDIEYQNKRKKNDELFSNWYDLEKKVFKR